MNGSGTAGFPAEDSRPARNRGTRRVPPVFWAIAGAAVLLAAVFLLWKNGAFLPRWILWKEAELSLSDTASDTSSGSGAARILLRDRRVSVIENGETVYTSPREWFISDLLVCDLDADGTEEILLLAWKRGSYDGAMPFWVKRDEISFSQHIFIFNFREHTLKPLWMSSRLGISVRDWHIDTGARLHLTAADGEETVWYWNFWGLALLEP